MTKKRPLSAPDSSQPEETPGPHSERLEGSGTHAIPLGLRESLDHSPDLVFVAGPDGRVIWANRAYDQLTGLDRTELVGEPFPSLVSGPSRRIAQHYIAQKHERSTLNLRGATLAGSDSSTVLRARTAAGGKRRADPGMAMRVRWMEGAEADGLFVGVARPAGADPGSLRARLNEIAARVLEAGTAARVRNEFLESMSDEIRTPIVRFPAADATSVEVFLT